MSCLVVLIPPAWANKIAHQITSLQQQVTANQAATLLAIQQLHQEFTKTMSTTNDAILAAAQAAEANFATTKTALTGIATGVSALDAKIITLEQEVAAGGVPLSDAAKAALAAVVSGSADLLAQASGISTADPTPAAPAPPSTAAATAPSV